MKSNRDLVLVSLSRSYVSLLFVGGRAFGLAGAVSRVRFDIPRASSPLSLLLSQLFFGSDNLLRDGLLTYCQWHSDCAFGGKRVCLW